MPSNNGEIEKRLWRAADEMRANSKLKSSEYSVPVLGLIFLRFADFKFNQVEVDLLEEEKIVARRRRGIGKIDFQARGVMYLPEAARWEALMQLPEGANIGKAINDAMRAIEEENEDLKDILPDQSANQFGMDRKAILVIAERIRSLTPKADISEVMEAVGDLLDDSIVPTKAGYVIQEPAVGGQYLDLSKIDFDALKQQFEKGHMRIQAEKLRGQLNSKLLKMLRLNRTRMDYYQKYQEMIDEYNTGAKNVDAFYTELISLAQNLNEEEARGMSENLSEEELALFDLLTRPDVKLTRKEKAQVKKIARDLLDTLKAERLVLDWRKRQQTRAAVKVIIRDKRDELPEAYDDELYQQKSQLVYQHVYDAYPRAGRSIYG
jgi:hypothetical protein